VPSKMFSISSHFVLREAVSQTKYCCSPEIKHFDPQFLGWLRDCWVATGEELFSHDNTALCPSVEKNNAATNGKVPEETYQGVCIHFKV